MKGWKLTLEKVDGLVSDQISGQILSRIHTAHNECTIAVSAFPQFNETGLLLGLLKFDCESMLKLCLVWQNDRYKTVKDRDSFPATSVTYSYDASLRLNQRGYQSRSNVQGV